MTDVLVGVDDDSAGAAALQWAIEHAHVHGSAVTAMHVQPRTPVTVGAGAPGLPNRSPAGAAHGCSTKSAVVARAIAARPTPAAHPIDVNVCVETGPIASALAARARDAGVLVLGRRARPLLRRVASGSVIDAALHHVDGPVVVVPEDWSSAYPAANPRVVVGVAPQHAFDDALAWAVREATRRECPLVPVQVRAPAAALESAQDLDGRVLQRLVEASLTAQPGSQLLVEPEVLVGEPGPELVRHARPGDLLVVGSRGRSPLAGWLLGSTSTHCVHHAECPVVVVPDGSDVMGAA